MIHEVTEARKYEMLARELEQLHPGTRVSIVPDGLVTKFFKRHMAAFGVPRRVQAYLQSLVIKCTTESVLIDCRTQLDAEVGNVEEMFDGIEAQSL